MKGEDDGDWIHHKPQDAFCQKDGADVSAVPSKKTK
jgi:hypothetical protein